MCSVIKVQYMYNKVNWKLEVAENGIPKFYLLEVTFLQ